MSSNDVRRIAADAAVLAERVSLSPAAAAPGDAIDFSAFADTMATLATTVCIAAAASGDVRHGRTVTAVSSLSANPPSLLVSITKGSDLALLIAQTGRFSLNLLAEDQREIGDAFAGKLGVKERFSLGNWAQWPSGQPRLEGAATAIDCQVAGAIELDTHCLFVGVLTGTRTSAAKPLLWYQRGYRTLAEKG